MPNDKKVLTLGINKVKSDFDKEELREAIKNMIVILKEDRDQENIRIIFEDDRIEGGMKDIIALFELNKKMIILPENSILVID